MGAYKPESPGLPHNFSPASRPARKEIARMIPGGLSDAKPATPEIQDMVNEIKPQLEEKTNETYEKFEAVEYKTQVVAGINYFVKVDVGGDKFIHLRLFKGLPGQNEDLELSGYQANKTKEDEITYF